MPGGGGGQLLAGGGGQLLAGGEGPLLAGGGGGQLLAGGHDVGTNSDTVAVATRSLAMRYAYARSYYPLLVSQMVNMDNWIHWLITFWVFLILSYV